MRPLLLVLAVLLVPTVAAVCEVDTSNASTLLESLTGIDLEECELTVPRPIAALTGDAAIAVQVGEEVLAVTLDSGRLVSVVQNATLEAADYALNLTEERLDDILGSDKPAEAFVKSYRSRELTVEASGVWGRVKLWAVRTIAPLFF